MDSSEIRNIALKFELALQDDKSIYLDSSDWIDLMEHYLNTKQYKYASEAADAAGDIFPTNIEVCVTRCQVYIYTDQPDCATPILNELIANHSEYPHTHVLSGMFQSAQGYHETAIKTFLSVYDTYDDLCYLNYLIAHEYDILNNTGMTIRYYQKALAEDPSDSSYTDRLVELYTKSESYTLATHFFEKLTKKDPYNSRLWQHLGFFYVKNKDTDSAIKALENATYISPEWSLPYYDLSEILFEAEKYTEAIRTLKRLLSYSNVEDPFPYTMLGKCYHQIGQTELSCEYFLKAIHYDPLKAEGWYNLSLVHFTSGYQKQALDYIYRGLKCDPTDIECLRLTWEIEESLHMWDKAEIHLKELVSSSDSTEEDYMDYAYFLYEREQYTEALKILQDTRQLFDQCHETLYHMSAVYFALSEYEKGINMLKKALSLAPELLHVIQDNYPELLDLAPVLRQYLSIEKDKS